MRNFLVDKVIVGVLLASRAGNLLHRSIPSLLEYCDWVYVLLDNEDNLTRGIVSQYMAENSGRVRRGFSGFPRAPKFIRNYNEDSPHLLTRFKTLQGHIREEALKYIQRRQAAGERIDAIIWPDSDEILTDRLPGVLEAFMANDDVLGVTTRPITVFGDEYHLCEEGMGSHTRIIKPRPDQYFVPYTSLCRVWGIGKRQKMAAPAILLHLAYLDAENRQWRARVWSGEIRPQGRVWRLPKSAFELSGEEIMAAMRLEPETTVEEYLKNTNLS